MLGKKAPPGASTSAAPADDAFFHDIETLSKALSLDSSASSSKHRFSAPTKSSSHKSKDKKLPSNPSSSSSSFWSWKPLRALTHIRNNHRRLHVLFSLHVHSIHNLPPPLDDAASLVVFWKRTTDPSAAASSTCPARAHRGAAHFDDVEPLVHRCSVYYSASSSSRGGSGGGASAKYEPRHFVIWAAAEHAPALDLGRHLVDLTRILPLTLDQILEDNVEGRWTTSFKLSGKAKGAILNVSFGYSLFSGSIEPEKKSLDLLKQRSVKRTSSLPLPHQRNGPASRSVDDVRVLHEVPPSSKTELTSITNSEKFEDEQVGIVLEDEFAEEENELLDMKQNAAEEFEKPELTLQQGVENIEMDLEKVHEVVDKVLDLAEFANESNMKFESFDENEVDKSKMKSLKVLEPVKENLESEDSQFMVVEKGVEIAEVLEKIENEVAKETTPSCLEQLTAELDNTRLVLSSQSHGLEGNCLVESNNLIQDLSNDLDESSSVVSYSATQDFDIALSDLYILESGVPETPLLEDKSSADSCDSEFKSICKGGRLKSKSLNSNDEVVASEFLSMLGIEHSPFGLSSDSDPESPRERLWRQFEKEALANGDIFGLDIEQHNEAPMDNGNLYGFDNGVENELDVTGFSDDFDLASLVFEAEAELQKATEAINSKSRAKMLEDAETEALMREFGLNEKAFQQSPPGSRGGFGSPIDILPEEPMELPPLGEGLGPFIQTKDGGFLRSMSPYLFKNANSHGRLVMQVSNPVVVPAEMGSGVMEVLQRLASVGIEKLSMQASKLMPLEDISGKTMQQVAWEAGSSFVGYESREILQNNPDAVADALASGRRKKVKGLDLGSANTGGVGSEYVSLEDLAPLAMDQIEALSIEGLRIQSGMSDEEAPSNISALTMGDMSALEGKGPNNNGSLGLQGAAGLQLLDVKDNGEDVDGLMGLSLTLDEWMRLDSGIVDEDGQISDRTAKILAAHHASSSELISGGWKGVKGGGRRSGKRWGLLGNNFTVALMVQLRDPLRNYEPVGTPMLSLIQVERVFVPPKPKIYRAVPEKDHREEGDKPATKTDQPSKEEKNEEVEAVPQFKIAEVHVAGLRTEPSNKKVWGNQMQQQSGSRWLLANGMGKSNKHPLMKSKGLIKPSLTTTSGDSLWSISSQKNSFGAKWKEKAGWNPHIRNPDITLPNKNIRFH